MKVATAAQMRELDRIAIEEHGIPSIQLMERAGEGAARAIQRRFGDATGRTVFVFCGKGNNGGDGFVVARYLREWGARVRVFLFGSPEGLTPDASANFDRLERAGLPIVTLAATQDLSEVEKALEDADVVVDAIFGTGFEGAPRPPLDAVIELVNRADCPVASLDVPSGLNGDSGSARGAVVHADLTPTFGLPKLGLILFPGRSLAGEVDVVDIGIPEAASETVGVRVDLVEPEAARALLPERRPNAHKGDCGKLLVVGGSVGLTGAVVLAANAAARAGAGLVTAAVPAGLNDVFEIKLTEVMTLPLADTADRCLCPAAADTVLERARECRSVVVGPGLSRHDDAGELARLLGEALEVPAVIDADALYAYRGRAEELRRARAPRVLTPHPGEAAGLLSCPIAEVSADPIGAAVRMAETTGCVSVVKGAPTVVAAPGSVARINPTGNAALATGGTGDVLAGVIAALIAQGCDPEDAAVLGVFVHGLAGDIGSESLGVRGLLATDLLDLVPIAINSLEAGEAELPWIR